MLDEALLHDSDTQHWRAWCKRSGVPFRPRGGERRFDDYDLVLSAAEAGVGVAIARWPLAAHVVPSGRLVRIDEFDFPDKDAHYIVTRTGDVRRAIRQLASRLIEMAAVSP